MSLDKGATGSLDKLQVPTVTIDAQGNIILNVQGNSINIGVVNLP